MKKVKEAPTRRQWFDKVVEDAKKQDALRDRIDKLELKYDKMCDADNLYANEQLPEKVEVGEYIHNGREVAVRRDGMKRGDVYITEAPVFKKV